MTIRTSSLLQSGLRTGDPVDERILRNLEVIEARCGARELVLRLLSRRPRSEKELRLRLEKKSYDEKFVDEIITNLKQTGLLNDREVARAYVHDQLTLKPAGRRLLHQKLQSLGIQQDVAVAATETITDSGELQSARKAAVKYLRTRGKRTDKAEKLRTRLSSFLGRRGFDWETIRTVVKEIPELHSPESDR
jgi:regulatory protein